MELSGCSGFDVTMRKSGPRAGRAVSDFVFSYSLSWRSHSASAACNTKQPQRSRETTVLNYVNRPAFTRVITIASPAVAEMLRKARRRVTPVGTVLDGSVDIRVRATAVDSDSQTVIVLCLGSRNMR